MATAFRRFGKRLLVSGTFQNIAAAVVHRALRFIYWSNRKSADSDDLVKAVEGKLPVIIALWHGQQLLTQFVYPDNNSVAALVSRSRDAEINARVLKLSGVTVIRGSGGRERAQTARKGGVGALKGMADALADGKNIVMIADISKGAPRQSGEGIVALAKLSGRPIIPMALATSRYHIVEKSWDKTTINLPFGEVCLKLGPPISVPRDTSDAELEEYRQRVTDELNSVTEKAYRAVRNGA
ncbi:lysophospholipid acyltransferase family protein [Nitratireductor sp. XY-223]|uniref:lysophospholipid acyltransferase family protein n=1 Tax=Nitratireductor sp. XY-223 TaxID=2561926 RepID=UPI00145ACD0E|nr:lysophospholipid acyltransferase family protein [Nitratireductor sp. XY-223]